MTARCACHNGEDRGDRGSGVGCRVMLCGMGRVLNCMNMTAKVTTLNELGETLTFVVQHMVTKDDIKEMATKADIAALGEQIASIERDLKQIRRDLYELAEKVENVTGYRKEIDHALERIAAIERHLGINKKIALKEP